MSDIAELYPLPPIEIPKVGQSGQVEYILHRSAVIAGHVSTALRVHPIEASLRWYADEVKVGTQLLTLAPVPLWTLMLGWHAMARVSAAAGTLIRFNLRRVGSIREVQLLMQVVELDFS